VDAVVPVLDADGIAMATLPDLLYFALFAVVLPLWDYLVSWIAFRRQSRADPARARRRLWTGAIVYPWALVAAGAAIWMAHGRSWASFGFSVPEGWRLWASLGLILLLVAYLVPSAATVARSAEARASVRAQCSGELPAVLPHTRTEMYWFGVVALTAGFCEEFLFRGYFLWVCTPWLGWWGAAALSVLIFAGGHAYQGWNGVIRTGVVGVLFTLVVAMTNSLWPAIVLHFVLDLGMGILAWLALRDGPATGGGEDAGRPTETQSALGVESGPARGEPGAAPDRGGKSVSPG
jgi:membrane protease YdiL (CAAX protease family)